MIRIVIDPGHGGDAARGGSTPYGARGGSGACEKELALDVARRVREHAPELVLLTRDGDRNLSFAERIRVARDASAAAFVSIHVGGAGGGADAETWIHPRASIGSRLLAARTAGELAGATGAPAGPPLEGPLAVLDPDRHAPGCDACLVELGRLGDPTGEGRLLDAGHRRTLADAIARGLLADPRVGLGPTTVAASVQRERFDIWHEVPLVQQLTGMSCWAAAAAMIVGWRDCIDIDAEEVARGAGRWHAYRDGLEPRDVEGFARAWGLEVARLASMSVAELRRSIETYGPLWVGEASPGLHVVVVAGLHGDGTPEGTFVRIADPWPVGRGERYTISFREFREHLQAAATLAGGRPQILHAGGRRRGVTHSASMSSTASVLASSRRSPR